MAKDYFDIVELLLLNGATYESDGYTTPLRIAIEKGNLKLVKLFADKENINDPSEETIAGIDHVRNVLSKKLHGYDNTSHIDIRKILSIEYVDHSSRPLDIAWIKFKDNMLEKTVSFNSRIQIIKFLISKGGKCRTVKSSTILFEMTESYAHLMFKKDVTELILFIREL